MIDIDLKEFGIKDNESDEEYQYRISAMRDANGWTWTDVAELINNQTGASYTESKYRKDWKNYCAGYNAGRFKKQDIDEYPVERHSPNDSDRLENLNFEMRKERVRMQDERIQMNAYIRNAARNELYKEIAMDAVEKMGSIKLLHSIHDVDADADAEAILMISDWHYGIDCKNFWNTYNPEIAADRISYLLHKTKKYCKENGVSRIHVVNLSDLIAGRIHLPLRIESRFDVITQIMRVSEMLAEFLNDLYEDVDVDYYDCYDNHSRLEPNKNDAMDDEQLSRITHWYLVGRLGDKINVHHNEFDEAIITFNIAGRNVIGVHGDKDKPYHVVERLSAMTHENYDLVLMAHLHHFGADEQTETTVLMNGSLMGTDTYAKNLRLASKASQNLLILRRDDPDLHIVKIVLN